MSKITFRAFVVFLFSGTFVFSAEEDKHKAEACRKLSARAAQSKGSVKKRSSESLEQLSRQETEVLGEFKYEMENLRDLTGRLGPFAAAPKLENYVKNMQETLLRAGAAYGRLFVFLEALKATNPVRYALVSKHLSRMSLNMEYNPTEHFRQVAKNWKHDTQESRKDIITAFLIWPLGHVVIWAALPEIAPGTPYWNALQYALHSAWGVPPLASALSFYASFGATSLKSVHLGWVYEPWLRLKFSRAFWDGVKAHVKQVPKYKRAWFSSTIMGLDLGSEVFVSTRFLVNTEKKLSELSQLFQEKALTQASHSSKSIADAFAVLDKKYSPSRLRQILSRGNKGVYRRLENVLNYHWEVLSLAEKHGYINSEGEILFDFSENKKFYTTDLGEIMKDSTEAFLTEKDSSSIDNLSEFIHFEETVGLVQQVKLVEILSTGEAGTVFSALRLRAKSQNVKLHIDFHVKMVNHDEAILSLDNQQFVDIFLQVSGLQTLGLVDDSYIFEDSMYVPRDIRRSFAEHVIESADFKEKLSEDFEKNMGPYLAKGFSAATISRIRPDSPSDTDVAGNSESSETSHDQSPSGEAEP